MNTYFELLPSELFYSLCCYLYIKPIEDLCRITKKFRNTCDDDNLWKFKINHEFPYIDNQDKISSIFTPRLKYIQLKSIRYVDFGSEYFQRMILYLTRASRVKDHNVAYNLIVKVLEHEEVDNLNYITVLSGAIASNNKLLINEYKKKVIAILPETISAAYAGYVEGGDDEVSIAMINNLLGSTVRIQNVSYVIPNAALLGLVRGGHLDELKKFNDPNIHEYLFRAAEFQQWAVVDYLLARYFSLADMNDHGRLTALFEYIKVLVEVWENQRFIRTYEKYKTYFYSADMTIRHVPIHGLFEYALVFGNIFVLDYLIKNKIYVVSIDQYDLADLYQFPVIQNQLDMMKHLERYRPLKHYSCVKTFITK